MSYRSEELNFDSVVMLTWSNWYKELRSNRYHYATRFAKLKPVIFVQPDLSYPRYQFKKTEIPNITVLHIYHMPGDIQSNLLNKALAQKHCLNPLFWIYNIRFYDFIQNRHSVLNVYHATEDYLSSNSPISIKSDKNQYHQFNETLKACQLMVAVTENVARLNNAHSDFTGKTLVATNGCDYNFYSPESISEALKKAPQKTVFYQGNIFNKLDYELLLTLTKRLPDWHFQFCGNVPYEEPGWKAVLQQPNVRYSGVLSPEQIRAYSHQATVGIIPFINDQGWLIKSSLPLKAFEYLACGLPVVSAPIESLLPYKEVFDFATTTDEYEQAILKSYQRRYDEEDLIKRLKVSASQDYDIKFQSVLKDIKQLITEKEQKKIESPFNIVLLYSPLKNRDGLEEKRLLTLKNHSDHNISFLPVNNINPGHLDIKGIDAIIVYSDAKNPISTKSCSIILKQLNSFGGYKILCSDLDLIEKWRSLIKKNQGVHHLLALSSSESIEQISKKIDKAISEKIKNIFRDTKASPAPLLLEQEITNDIFKLVSTPSRYLITKVQMQQYTLHYFLKFKWMASFIIKFKLYAILSIKRSIQLLPNSMVSFIVKMIPRPIKQFIKNNT